MPDLPIEGGCRCGRVRFRLSEAPWMETACHCRGCQRMTASAFSTTLVMPASGFAVTGGETAIGGLHGDEADHHHCHWCKNWVFTKYRADLGLVNIRDLARRRRLVRPLERYADWREAALDRNRSRA